MPSGPRLLARFDDFAGGEHGLVLARRATPTQFTGRNVIVYSDRSIGPRGGFKNMAITGMPSTGAIAMEFHNQADFPGGHNAVVFLSGTQVYVVDVHLAGQAAVLATGTIAGGVPSAADMVATDGRQVFLTVAGDKCYVLDTQPQPPTLTAISGSPGGRCITAWNDYLVVADIGPDAGHAPGSTRNRIQWSAPANFSSWPATNFLDVGTPTGGEWIWGLRVLRDTLVVVTNYGSIFLITGTLGVNATVREFLPGENMLGPQAANNFAVDREGTLWWARNAPGNTAAPIAFSGAQRLELPEQAGWLRARQTNSHDSGAKVAVVTLNEARSVVFVSEIDYSPDPTTPYKRFLFNRNGTWTRHDTAEIVGRDYVRMVAATQGELYCLVTPVQTPGPLRLYKWMVEIDQPASVSTGSGVADGAATTAPVCEFTTAEVTSKDGGEMVVAWIDVAFTKYDTDAAQTNHFEVKVNVTDAYESGPPSTDVQTWDEAPTVTARERRRFQFQARPGRGFSVTFSNIRGVKIDDVLVFGVSQEPRL